jgi:hypothetical protein
MPQTMGDHRIMGENLIDALGLDGAINHAQSLSKDDRVRRFWSKVLRYLRHRPTQRRRGYAPLNH